AKWYELHYSAPGWNVTGISVPGIPLVVVGHNDSIAWGFTNAMLDDCDFYFEEEDTLDANNYVFKNKSIPIRSREEIIYIGSSDSIEFTARSTHHGPVINDVHPMSEHDHRDSMHEKNIITMRWIGYDYSDEMLGFYRINRSRNKIEFENGLKELAVPAQCAVYADAGGNIGWWLAGKVPIRGKYNGTLPYDGESGDDEWQGFVPFDELPKAWNPNDGLIILVLTENILQVYNADSTSDPPVAAALVYLRNWNFRCTPTDIASTIVNKYFVKLIHNIYEDELGKDVFHDFIYSLAPVYRVTIHLLQSESSSWFDDVKTDTMETKEMIIRKSFLEAIDELQTTFGNEMKTWQWGKIHQVLFEHPLGRYKPLDKVFNVGPFPVGGSEQTINKGAFKLTDPFFLFASPSMRQVVDMAKPTSSYAVITLGQSGQPLHEHYDDQVSLWLNGGYRETTIDWTEIKNQKWKHLILKPK
ncbi:MAG: penicillin acylase family protein, partial [Ignavibacteriales bacterium]|nr:penicillin acylase family protein [Ignavibacteriales bacterium]